MSGKLQFFAILLFSFIVFSYLVQAATVPGSVGSFTTTASQVTEKDTVTLAWSKPSGFSGTVKYNL